MAVLSRLELLRACMGVDQVAAAIITRSANVSYITGFDGLDDHEDPHVAVVTTSSATLFTDSRYDEVAAAQAADTGWRVERPAYPYIDSVADRVRQQIGSHAAVAVEDTVAHRVFAAWSKALHPLTVRPTDGWIERIRATKDAVEIDRITRAQAIADEAWSHMLGWLSVGQTEREAAMELEFALRRLGADSVAFPSIVASGPNGSRPHAIPGERAFERGDLVTFDFGAKVDGYHSDMTRTVAIGEVSDARRHIYDTVLAANRAGVRAVRAGATGAEVDAAARDVISAAHMGEYFGHGTGHGVGLAVHEHPSIAPRSEWVLEAGMVITVEPGIYVPGEAGVRIEDLVVVTDDGAQVLSASPRELYVVDR